MTPSFAPGRARHADRARRSRTPPLPARLTGVALALVLASLLAAIVAPGSALAHAAFVSSQPEPGQQVSSVPGVVSLRFTEPINPTLSRAVVTGPGGLRAEGAATREGEVQVRLGGDVPGVYQVDWTTVSLVDGHTLRGSFRFGVRTAPGSEAEGVTRVTPHWTDLLVAGARLLEDVGLLAAVGMLLLTALAARPPALPWVRLPLRWPLLAAFVGGLLVVLGEALAAAPSPSLAAIGAYLAGGLPGMARLLRVTAEAAALSLSTFGPAPAAAPLGLALVGLAAAGHAAAARPGWAGIAVDALHLLAAGLWAGGILALASLRPPGGWRGEAGRELLRRFTPVALPAFGLAVGFGALRAVQELDGPGSLLTSAYGQVLAFKIAVVLALLPLSFVAWRRRAARPRAEAALAVAIVAAAALLAAFPLPPGRAGEAEEAAAGATSAPALPRPGDLSLASEAGDVLVGLTVRPDAPGTSQLLVYLLPLGGEADAARLGATLTADGRPVSLAPCGAACRTASLALRGGEQVEVHVDGANGGTARFSLPALPAPDGTALLEQVQRRMHQLTTYRVAEELRPAVQPLLTRYLFRAPDRMHMQVSSGYESVWVGPTRYERSGQGASWRVEKMGAGISVPGFVWDAPAGEHAEYVAARIVGTTSVDGVSTRELAFFLRLDQAPIWFRLWVDAEGLVHRAEMRAQGHFMDQQLGAFDAPGTVEPPGATAAAP